MEDKIINKDDAKQVAELLAAAKKDSHVYDCLSIALKSFIDGLNMGLTIKNKVEPSN